VLLLGEALDRAAVGASLALLRAAIDVARQQVIQHFLAVHAPTGKVSRDRIEDLPLDLRERGLARLRGLDLDRLDSATT
jgi:hypothetical protein